MNYYRAECVFLCGLAILFLAVSPVAASEWPQWRGPFLNGSSDEKGLPERWTKEDGVLWTAPMPGEGGSTPVIQGGCVFLTSTDRKNNDLHAICLDARNGKTRWTKIFSGEGRSVPYNKDAAPSAIADGTRVYFLFGTGDFASYDYQGNEVWRRNLEADHGALTQLFLYGASPLLFRNRLYLSVLRGNPGGEAHYPKEIVEPHESFLLCVDPDTGRDIWRVRRHFEDTAPENLDSYATPAVWESGSLAEILAIGANYLTAHDWLTGQENWRMRYMEEGKYRQRVVPSPVVVGDRVVCSKPRCGPLFSIRPGRKGEIPFDECEWEYEGLTPDVPSVLSYGGRLYAIHDSKKTLTCLDPESGGKIWEGKLEGEAIYHASPTGADGKIYCMNLAGEIVVVRAADEFHILSRISMGGKPSMSTIAVADGC
ncbi:MAG TPA: PQQ-binding-like beta-propeller repeat protein, partial [bacterium]|nr:PQQ-binding-like beta-propeller repeat protein [bacterium]